jgi:Rap1a immunity proteins
VGAGDVADKIDYTDEAARRVTSECHNALKSIGLETSELGTCLGVLKGLHYLSPDMCIPPSISLGDIAAVVSRHFDAHPEQLQNDFREVSLEAMRLAWPCAAKNSI